MWDADKFDDEANNDLAVISEAVVTIADLEAMVAQKVRGLRLRFVPWVDISLALGVTRQAAQQRYGGSRDRSTPNGSVVTGGLF